MEKNLTDPECGYATITIQSEIHVNNDGEFTLLDLGIDARYLFLPASMPELAAYNPDIVMDGMIDANDLSKIAEYMLGNPNYIL